MKKQENQQEIKAPYNGKFKITLEDLVKISSAGQERTFSQEVDLLEELGGYQYVEKNLFTDFKNGLKCDPWQPNEFSTEEEIRHNKNMPGRISDYDERNEVFQNNIKPIIPPNSFCTLLFNALNDFTLKILIVAAFVSIIIEVSTADDHERPLSWIEGFAILVAVMVCSLVAAVNDYQKEKQFQVLNSVSDSRLVVSVIRSGQEQIIHQDLVMTGDIIKLSEGMQIPADGIVIHAADLTTDESAMTGETDPVKKNVLPVCIQERNKIIAENSKNTAEKHDVSSPVIMSGTKTLTGEGLMVVIVVGDSSCLGKIKALMRNDEKTQTPLEVKLEKIAEDIGLFGLYSSIAIVVVMLIRFTIERIYEDEFKAKEHIGEMLNFFIIGITVVVVAIPEGLPLAVTLSLAYSVKKMLLDQNLVRKLGACETMGGANNICSDKTGTLTKNEMTLVQWWNGETVTFPDQAQYQLENYMSQQFTPLFLQSTAVNSSAQMHPEEKGSKTETAVLKFLMKTKYDYREIRKTEIEVRKFPFSSARKRMSTIIETQGKQRILVKGASEMVLRSCTKWIHKQTGEIRNLDENQKQIVEKAILSMANDALRTICLAYKDLNGKEDLESKDNLGVYDIETSDLTLVAIFGIADIVRPEVPEAVRKCFEAGIKVRMVTGDNKDTARAIAAQCKIINANNKDDLVIEGPDFIKLTGGVVCKKCRTYFCDCPRDKETAKIKGKKIRVDTIKNGEAFDKIYPHLCVMARSRPEDKYALVTGLIERGHVIAVTGDGTNDAPALKKADVGFAMGIAGTSVARDASDIILLDDNFNSIVKAVMWGRNIYDSIRKFLQFQLTVNVVAVTITLVSAAITKQEVLTPIQMLWVNLIMDTFASLALATEPPTEALLQRAPHNRNQYIISKKMTKHIFGQALLQILVLLLLTFGGEKFLPEWESKEFKDKIPELIQDYSDTLSEKSRATNESLRYLARHPFSYQFSDSSKDYVVSGRLRSYSGFDKEYYHIFKVFQTPSRHFTYIFNVFVLFQLFNFLNARKLRDELNIFEGITRNYLFGIILAIIIIFQIIVVTFGGTAFHCFSFYGLRIEQWLICIGFALLGNINSIIIKQVPEEKIFKCKIYDNAADDDEKEEDEDQEDDDQQPLKGEAKESANGTGGSSPQKEIGIELISQKENSNNKQMDSTKAVEENSYKNQNKLASNSNNKNMLVNSNNENYQERTAVNSNYPQDEEDHSSKQQQPQKVQEHVKPIQHQQDTPQEQKITEQDQSDKMSRNQNESYAKQAPEDEDVHEQNDEQQAYQENME